MSRLSMIALFVFCGVPAFAQAPAPDTQSQTSSNLSSSSQSSRPQQVRVAGGVMLGMVQQKTMPVYPGEAMIKGIQGDVIFKVFVDETGKIIAAVPVEGHPLLTAAGVDALRSFRFQPYLLNGSPVKVESQLGYDFSIKTNSGGINGQVECIASIPNRPEFQTGVVTDKDVLILRPRKVSGVEPKLPPEVAGQSGSVYLRIMIGTDGKVAKVDVVGGDEPFIAPVVAAVKQNIYEPEMIDGKPSAAVTEASYHFGPQR